MTVSSICDFVLISSIFVLFQCCLLTINHIRSFGTRYKRIFESQFWSTISVHWIILKIRLIRHFCIKSWRFQKLCLSLLLAVIPIFIPPMPSYNFIAPSYNFMPLRILFIYLFLIYLLIRVGVHIYVKSYNTF